MNTTSTVLGFKEWLAMKQRKQQLIARIKRHLRRQKVKQGRYVVASDES